MYKRQDYVSGTKVLALGHEWESVGSWVVNGDGTISPHDAPHLVLGWGDFTTASCFELVGPEPNKLVLMDSSSPAGPIFRAKCVRYDCGGHCGHYYDYYDDDDDDDDDGGTELVMSGGLVAIGLTFTGISIAAIANALQEQCALGPTIVYEAGTTHPYYISPNLCTIGTKTFSSDKTVRDASPRKVCRKFCEAASEKGKLALKHVQGLTCYCKRR